MKYFLDTEFLEGPQKDWFGRETKPTIDLISIGIISEEEREYYAISKDFNLKEAWNRFDEKINRAYPQGPEYIKIYWIRENVLKPIFIELLELDKEYLLRQQRIIGYAPILNTKFTYRNFKRLLKRYGKTNEEIAKEIKRFIYNPESVRPMGTGEQIEFYAYYADYDWVVFCWIFGKMIDLPKGFPMYCKDLKQILDEVALLERIDVENNIKYFPKTIEDGLEKLKNHPGFPKQENEHNALDDARWNLRLYNFLNQI